MKSLEKVRTEAKQSQTGSMTNRRIMENDKPWDKPKKSENTIAQRPSGMEAQDKLGLSQFLNISVLPRPSRHNLASCTTCPAQKHKRFAQNKTSQLHSIGADSRMSRDLVSITWIYDSVNMCSSSAIGERRLNPVISPSAITPNHYALT